MPVTTDSFTDEITTLSLSATSHTVQDLISSYSSNMSEPTVYNRTYATTL
ncbi:hypothetical protein IQ243_27150 [Nostocales cyanobacterium LEGE 11386]|nr:hypothetical protein [Nostocales cyanobacterium LEGE 11386]